VTSASSAKWKSEYRAVYKDHRSVNTGGRRAAHWASVAEKRTAELIKREKEERKRRGEPVMDGWPSYAIKYTHREGGETKVGQGREMVSVLREMKTDPLWLVPVSAIKRPIKRTQEQKPPWSGDDPLYHRVLLY
jgi:hypothetical protein